MSDIRVLLVDDHPVVRAGLAGMLAADEGIAVVGEAGDGEAALRLAAELDPDVVLMDLRLLGLDGVEATARLHARHPRTRVVVLTTYSTDNDILRAVEAGAAGYLLKDVTASALAAAVRAAARGETVLAAPVATRLMTELRRGASERLTPRESDVLRLVAEGLSNAEIGARLYISETTVKSHLQRVFSKLGVDDRTRAVTVAITRGLIATHER
jgi:DNA-binding NarL/FixJ family response regulator